jgi:peroxiredoxin
VSADYASLPPDLPVPVDDGGADHLTGLALPPGLALESTHGGTADLAELARNPLDVALPAGMRKEVRHLVVYVYPRTGVPGEPLPPGWDEIPGARGCTPQSCAYRDSLEELLDLGAVVIGISAQSPAEQREFADREQIPFPLLSDPGLRLAAELRLPTFEAAGMTLYRRLTFVAEAGAIVRVFYPVFPPDRNAAEVLDFLR